MSPFFPCFFFWSSPRYFQCFPLSFSTERACKSLSSKQSLVTPSFVIKLLPSEQDNFHPSKIPPPFSLLYSYNDLSFIFLSFLTYLFSLSLSLVPSTPSPCLSPLFHLLFSGVLIGNLSAYRPLLLLEP